MQLEESYRNDTSSHMFDFLLEDNRSFLLAWTVLLVVVVVASELHSVVFYAFSICVSRTIHRKAFRRVMNAPLAFFENNPVGKSLFVRLQSIILFEVDECYTRCNQIKSATDKGP